MSNENPLLKQQIKSVEELNQLYIKTDSIQKIAKNAASSFYYKNEGKFGLPSFSDINKESEITGISLEKLYEEHIEDMCRWYAIPTELDTVPSKKIHW